jgi:hypothetical protein
MMPNAKNNNSKTAKEIKEYQVNGQITDIGAQPISGVVVRAYDHSMRDEQMLGEQPTQSDGCYTITWTPIITKEKEKVDLVVRVFGTAKDKGDKLLAESSVIFNAQPSETIDLKVTDREYQGPSEYERITQPLLPLMQKISLSDLREDEEVQDITFLSNKTSIDSKKIDLLSAAAKLAKKTALDPEILYGFFRQGVPVDLPSLLSQNPETQRKALEAAIADNTIPLRVEQNVDQVLELLHNLAVQESEALLTNKVFLFKPEVLFGDLTNLSKLKGDESEFLVSRLNEHLRQELIAIIGPVSGAMSQALSLSLSRIDYRKCTDLCLKEVISEKILKELAKKPNLSSEVTGIERRFNGRGEGKVDELLHLQLSLKKNPILDKDIRTARILSYAKLAGLNNESAKKLVDKDLDMVNVNDLVLADLVKAGIITEEQKSGLKLVADLGRLTDDNTPFISSLISKGIKSTADFIGWRKNDWKNFISDNQVPLPSGKTIESYAETIQFNIERTYPSQALFSRMLDLPSVDRVGLLDSLNDLLKTNDMLVAGKKPAPIDWSKVDAAKRKQMQEDLRNLTGLANTYRHIGISDIINDKTIELDIKKSVVKIRIKLMDTFYKNNPGLDLRGVNFFDKNNETINWADISAGDKPSVRKQLMSYQRLFTLSDDVTECETLLGNGYDSAAAIVSETEAEFVKSSGLSRGQSRKIYDKAQKSALSTSHLLGTIHDSVRGQYKDLSVSNLSPTLINDLREIDGFDDFFGQQNYCDCTDYQSILSPAAYFVDLMHFIENNVSKPVFIESGLENHPLYLKNRRNDLWMLKLTYENTHRLIPYLTIVTGVLENYLSKVVSDDIYRKLSQNAAPDEKISFVLPFNLPLEELRIYLRHFGLSLHEVYRVLKLEDAKVWREKLNLSKDEYQVITEKDSGSVACRFGSPKEDVLKKFPVQDYAESAGQFQRGFIQFAGITRQQLDELLAISFYPDICKIQISTDPEPDEIQNFPEFLSNINYDLLDFIHRFIRLWKKTNWTIPELDMVLTSLKNIIMPDLTDPAAQSPGKDSAVRCVARLITLQDNLKLTAEELCAMVDQLPASKDFPQPPAREADKKLFERLFDVPKLFENPVTHQIKSPITFHHYSFNEENPQDKEIDYRTPLLHAGLGITETELLLLFDFLKGEMVFDTKGDCQLDGKKISLLYRHARLARAFKMEIADFIQALKLFFQKDNPVLRTIQQIQQVEEFAGWLRAVPFTVSELHFILNDIESATIKHKMNIEAVLEFIKEYQKQNNLFFQKDVLSDIKGISREKSAGILERMEEKGYIINAELGYSININKYPLTQKFEGIFPGIVISSETLRELREKLNEFHPFVATVTVKFNIKKELFHQLIKFINYELGCDDFINALKVEFDQDGNLKNHDDIAYIESIIEYFDEQERLLLLFEKLKFDSSAVEFITDFAFIFEIADLKNLKLSDIKALTSYKNQVTLSGGAELSLQKILRTKDYSSLADLWKQDKSLIESIVKSLTLSDIPIKALDHIKECLDICQTLGINGFSLQKLVNNADYDALIKAREVALGAFTSKYDDENVRREKLEPYIDRMNFRKRDILCDYIIARQKELKFKDLHDIYAFFLLDVEMSGCFRISHLVCAISSLQLYVHRCLMNLEQSDESLNPDVPNINVYPSHIPAGEWDWRKNYRVWEANRKVFLYSENYIEPELRTDKTHLFKELEDELLQQKITKESAEAAYKKYVAQLTELSKLRIAGSYYDIDSDIYYIFGRTNAQPYQYYYRTFGMTNTWGNWTKMELAIEAKEISAIIYMSRLYVFWTEVQHKEINKVSDGDSTSEGNLFKVYAKYAYLDENGKWSAPQRVYIGYINLSDYFLYLIVWQDYIERTDDNYDITIEKFKEIVFRKPYPIKTDDPALPLIQIYYIWSCYYDQEEYGENGNIIIINHASSHKLSLATNSIIEPATWDLFQALDIRKADFKFLQKEGDCSASSCYIQDGTKDFTSIELKINQEELYDSSITLRSHMKRYLSTVLIDELSQRIFSEGLDKFLSLETQRWIDEPGRALDFHGPYGIYYRELFFHIPFLIANHLNAEQKFKEAKWWYERIFNPTSAEEPVPENPTDRNWQYREFRPLDIEKMKEILNNQSAIDVYRNDPFNPHAIAGLRTCTYPKAIVMKYIDNLIDWGDYLFAQDTMESINEATMLYVLASDILGQRPVKLGACDTAGDQGLTYDRIGKEIGDSCEFFVMLENNVNTYIPAHTIARKELKATNFLLSPVPMAVAAYGQAGAQVRSYAEIEEAHNQYHESTEGEIEFNHNHSTDLVVASISSLIFCIPPNYDLLAYWDRVEDRLFKIRYCMNISGVRRQLALFQPPISPMMLVRAKAAGLSLEDILAMMEAQPPLYRFGYLVEKAKQFAQTVQSFGSALLSALEKKDIEELTLLRSVHECNILQMAKDIKKKQIQDAQYQYQAMLETETNVQNRIDYYQGLIDSGLTGWEKTQQITKHLASGLRAAEGILHLAEGVAALIPNVGSPFAITYGGRELSKGWEAWAYWAQTMASIANEISSSAGLEASFQRRAQEWKHQLVLARQELKHVKQQCLAAEIRQFIAEKDLEMHEMNIEQAEELDEFYKNKFTNLGLYNYLATSLNRLYREAYNMAYDMSRMAEKAYQFERDDDHMYIFADNWQYDRAGLLAGERLILQLHRMEKTYLENDVRDFEITQSFSMALLNPQALFDLKQKGICEFTVPEIAFDMFYPGQYKRLIKSVRLSIPCVVGPYTNISATLTLTGSKLRRDDKIIDPLPEMDNLAVAQNTSISTSSAQNDAGIFDLNFRDERYLPFEGAGAISTWELILPDKLRPFNYDTISDVIIHISYTAKYDREFRRQVEKKIEGILTTFATDNGLYRLLSMKHEFPNSLYKLLSTGGVQSAEFELTKEHFPYFLSNKELSLIQIKVYLKPEGENPVNTSGLVFKINNSEVSDTEWTVTIPNLKEVTIDSTDCPIMIWKIDATTGGLNKEELDDILLLLNYKIIT